MTEINGSHKCKKWASPDLPSRCTYKLDVTTIEDSPHRHKTRESYVRPKILPNVLYHINNTPMVKLNKIPKDEGLECEILAKCDFFNAGGSIKDRIGLRMVEEAEASGELKPGDVIIEPTSGNTGIGLALTAAVKGYRCIIVLPEKMSKEKVDVLKALGAEIIRTPTSASFDSPESNIRVAKRLLDEIPNSHVLDQYRNPYNPVAHYDGTAEEILEACDGKLDMVVCGAGTGGTIAGISRKIKEKCPSCIVVGVDPQGSILAQPEELNKTDTTFYEVEGIGYDFLPTVFDRKHVDKWYKSSDKPSFSMSRRLIREEGLLCGGSSGAAMSCAIQAAKDFGLKAGQRVVVVFPDSVRNYMTKFLSDDWLKARSLLDRKEECSDQELAWWRQEKIQSLKLKMPQTVPSESTIEETLEILNSKGDEFVAVVDPLTKSVVGVLTSTLLMSSVLNGDLSSKRSVNEIMNKQFKNLSTTDSLTNLSNLLETETHVVIFDNDKQKVGDGNPKTFLGVATRLDLAYFVANKGYSAPSGEPEQ